MKNILKHVLRISLGALALSIIWIISLQLAEIFITSNLETENASPGKALLLMYLASWLDTAVLYLMVIYSRWSGKLLVAWTALLIYGIKYFLSMIEALWFNDSLAMPISGIYNLLLAGIIVAVSFSPIIVWLGRKLKSVQVTGSRLETKQLPGNLYIKIGMLAIIAYPLIYFLAGYFIAWQFESVRMFYSGEIQDNSFFQMMRGNIESGLYFFQIPRALLWILFGYYTFQLIDGNWKLKGLIIGLLFATLMNAQQILPNPYFPDQVAMAHFIETFSSNFLWGFLISYVLQYDSVQIRKEAVTS